MTEWERTFELAVPVTRAWHEFVESDEVQAWNNPFRGDPYFSGGSVEVVVTGKEAEHHLRWEEHEGEDRVEMTVTFTEAASGTRLTVTRSGFGRGDEWLSRHDARWLGWVEAIHDFGVYLRTGTALHRHFNWRSTTGMEVVERTGGLEVAALTPDGWAAEAGLRRGDLIVRVAGAPVFELGDLWLLHSVLRGGADVSVDYVRDAELRAGTAQIGHGFV